MSVTGNETNNNLEGLSLSEQAKEQKPKVHDILATAKKVGDTELVNKLTTNINSIQAEAKIESQKIQNEAIDMRARVEIGNINNEQHFRVETLFAEAMPFAAQKGIKHGLETGDLYAA
ncbi:MAG: hypothetical protein N4A38_03370 [Candidatus Gracilibacteria bacterium]|nr:hypothetical protein [Candidatus Gracilibacteria bacterium]